jgi:hypothetical protein
MEEFFGYAEEPDLPFGFNLTVTDTAIFSETPSLPFGFTLVEVNAAILPEIPDILFGLVGVVEDLKGWIEAPSVPFATRPYFRRLRIFPLV